MTVKDISTGTIISSTTGDWATARNDHLELFNYKRYSFTFSLIDDDEGFAGNVSINLFKEGLQDLFTIENGVLKDVSEYSQNFIIPEGVKEVDSNICGKLGKYYNYFPSTLEKVDAYYLGRVTNISYYDIDVNNNYLKSIDGVIYSKDGRNLVRVPSKRTELKVEDGCEYVASSAFLYGLYESDGDEWFLRCSNLTKIELANSVKQICLETDNYYDRTEKKQCNKMGDYLETIETLSMRDFNLQEITYKGRTVKTQTFIKQIFGKTRNNGVLDLTDELNNTIKSNQ